MELRKAIINEGYRVRNTPSTYGWADYSVGVDEQVTALTEFTTEDPVEDIHWSEWGGTFDDNTNHYGIELHILSLGERWRYEGSITNLLQKLLK